MKEAFLLEFFGWLLNFHSVIVEKMERGAEKIRSRHRGNIVDISIRFLAPSISWCRLCVLFKSNSLTKVDWKAWET